MDDSPDLSDALDVDAGAAQRLRDSGKLARAIRRQPERQVSAHREPIVELSAQFGARAN
jgi:hypothetical protein